MKGVQYFYDQKGTPTAVLIDLTKNRRLWEDFQDIMVARQRRKQPQIPWEKVKKDLRRAGRTT